MPKHLALVLSALVALGGLLAWVMGISASAGETKGRVEYIEKRQAEDRQDTRTNLNELKEHIKIIDSNTQVILQKVTALEAIQRAERERNGR